ncbi:shikimate kinase AroL [Enterobacter cloacae complex sp. 2024EL-00215]|uniref:Shikimate kinase 2 n=1 Tax=Enterobacter mori TaxID=539813 RepID=A0A7T0H1F4_9ENTR|nr:MULTISPECIES: shikimate kinase AroL [Enterobacter]MBA7856970.1 shikimate kinase AroL [Enterobacter sp. RHBSTW-00901]QPK01477.1 shikimate kinase AroL [Enterobacter mori]BBS35997.1 shikimate kinase 2 [Enterobacter cloacae]
MNQPIFLVGPRGCGKTTVGLALARACQSQFIDTDHWLQEHAGQTIAEIVEKEGWESFRARETAALEAVTAPATVIATGGGIILAEYNRQFLREKGIVIYLCAPVSTLVGRLEAFPEEGQRPTLTGKPISEEVSDVLAERDALYREAAHHVVDASVSPEQVVDSVVTALRLARAS